MIILLMQFLFLLYLSAKMTDFIKREYFNNSTRCSFRILQWNILADGLTYSNEGLNFCKVPQQFLAWNHRKQRIIKHITDLCPDIICMQEVDHFNDFFVPELSSEGYKSYFFPRLQSACLDSPVNNGADGVALFFKNEKFTLKNLYKEFLHEEDGKLGRNVVLIVVLQRTQNNELLIVATTHFKAKDGFEKRRSAQSTSLLRFLESVKKNYVNASVILCGDFNCEITETCYKNIDESSLNLVNSYKQLTGEFTQYTTWKIRPTGEVKHAIDYVMFNSSVFSPSNVLLPPHEDLVPKERFPSSNHPSDHISLCVDFLFN